MNIEELKFFLGAEQKCSYLADQVSASVFVDPNEEMTTETYSVLIDHGFRRSSNYVYRPHCPECVSCIPARIPVNDFVPSRNQKRTWKRNSHISISTSAAEFNESHFLLYQKYISARHANGEMDNANKEQYLSFLTSSWCNSVFYEFKCDDVLVAVAATDHLTDSLSALYTFFDPLLDKQSLGTLAILWQIEKAKELNKKWLYLGYWIRESDKMSYKQNFNPLEVWKNNRWSLLKKKEIQL